MAVVYGFGSAGVDFRIRTADFGDTYKDKLLAQSWVEMGGGAVSNLLTQVSRLGIKAAFLGKLGNDVLGKKIVKLLGDENVDCSSVLFSDEDCSPFNVAVYSGEEMRRRCGFLIPNSLAKLTDEDIEALAAPITSEDFVMVEIGEIPAEQMIKFLKKVNEKGARVGLDVDLDPIRQCAFTAEQFDEICRFCDILIPNVVALSAIYPDETAASLAEKMYGIYGKPCVVSAGTDGAFYCFDETGAQNLPILKVDAIDTVGAGDAFHGGVVYGLVSGLPFKEAVRCGTICGALNCTAFGARTGMCNEPTLLEYLKKLQQEG